MKSHPDDTSEDGVVMVLPFFAPSTVRECVAATMGIEENHMIVATTLLMRTNRRASAYGAVVLRFTVRVAARLSCLEDANDY